jgi:hypothetical protein
MADDLVQIEPSEHVKNPGRVAWGKKLARMSKELKEKKKAQHGPSRTEPRPSKSKSDDK